MRGTSISADATAIVAGGKRRLARKRELARITQGQEESGGSGRLLSLGFRMHDSRFTSTSTSTMREREHEAWGSIDLPSPILCVLCVSAVQNLEFQLRLRAK